MTLPNSAVISHYDVSTMAPIADSTWNILHRRGLLGVGPARGACSRTTASGRWPIAWGKYLAEPSATMSKTPTGRRCPALGLYALAEDINAIAAIR